MNATEDSILIIGFFSLTWKRRGDRGINNWLLIYLHKIVFSFYLICQFIYFWWSNVTQYVDRILKLITENISRKYFQWLSNFPSEEVNCKKVLEHTCTQNNFSSRYRKASIWNKIELDMKILTRTFLDQISFWRSLMVYNQISYNGKQWYSVFYMYVFVSAVFNL